MHTLTHDIIISGAGPVGSTLALMLARKAARPDRIALIGRALHAHARTINPAGQACQADPRTLALNHGSRTLLQQLDAWPRHSADIHTVHVSQRGRLGRTIIDREELNVPRLGCVVSYDALLSTLHERLRQSGVDLIADVTTNLTLSNGHIQCTLPQNQLRAALSVQSDGRQPAGIHRHYQQNAVLTTVQASQPKVAWAYERFTRQGPLALLPHPHDAATYAVVWCCPPGQAENLKNLPEPRFEKILNHYFGDRLGILHTTGPRHVFPLALYAGPSLINTRTIAIGNAAQTLHPVAGQGLNLGLRDVAQLGLTLSAWLAQTNADPAPYLQEFSRRRRPDRWLTAGITDFLPRIFTTGNPLVEHACGLALLGLDLVGPARRILAQHLLQGLRT